MKIKFQFKTTAWLGGWLQLCGIVILTLSIDGGWLYRSLGFVLFLSDPIMVGLRMVDSFNKESSYYRQRLIISWILLILGF
ncbi:MAG: hypothetical protein H3C43_09695, partial [Leptonema sp. (in: Bacteria)]|nr:hypothetical protein [Leptonema sp. (in: bacteria)]